MVQDQDGQDINIHFPRHIPATKKNPIRAYQVYAKAM